MTSIYQAFRTEKTYETDGVVLDFGICKFKIRRAGGANRKFVNLLSSKMRPHRQAITAGTFSEDSANEILIDVYFQTVIVSWEGVFDENEMEVEYSYENFKKLMLDLPDLWRLIRDEADNMRNFQLAQVAVDGETLGKQ